MNNNYDNLCVEVNGCFEKLFDESFYMGAHYHPRIEIMYNVDGVFDFEYYKDNDSLPIISEVLPQSFVIIKSNVIHRLVLNKSETSRIINIEFCLTGKKNEKQIGDNVFHVNINNLLQYCNNLKDFFFDKEDYYIINDDGSFAKALRYYLKIASSNENTNEIKLQQYLSMYQLIIEFSRCFNNDNKKKIGSKYINLATKYIKANYNKKIYVEDIATNVGISKYYLQRLFRKYLNISLLDYINEYRIDMAKQFMQTSDVLLIDLYKLVGFKSRQALLYEFKKKENISLLSYKKSITRKDVNIPPSKDACDSTVEINQP